MQLSDVVAGLEWVGLNHKLPAVVTMSLGVKVCSHSRFPLYPLVMYCITCFGNRRTGALCSDCC